MRYLLRSLLCVSLSFCIVFSSSYSALANTTTEQVYNFDEPMLMSVAPSSDFYFYSGIYDKSSDVSNWSYFVLNGISSGDSINGTGNGYNGTLTSSVIPLFGVGLKSSTAIASDGDTLRIVIDDIVPSISFGVSGDQYLLGNSFNTYYNYAYMYFTATQQIGNTHSPTYTETIIPISNFMTPDSKLIGRCDIDISIPISAPPLPEGSNIDRLYNIQLKEIRLFTCLDVNNFINIYNNQNILDVVSLPFESRNRMRPRDNSVLFTQVNEGTSNDSAINIVNSIQSSLNGLNSIISNQNTQINNNITSSTNTITTKIDTMANDVKTGLQNVVTSAQQNTQNIINTVTQKVDQVKTGITEVKDSIIDLPNKLEEMLTGFFVPDEDTINSKYSEFETLLSDRFGLIYQSADIIHDFADSFQTQAIMVADTGGIIQLPSVTVNLAGTDFSFGGYDVDIIPDGFEFLQTAVRLATSMICTVVFVNMCKNKLEAILK